MMRDDIALFSTQQSPEVSDKKERRSTLAGSALQTEEGLEPSTSPLRKGRSIQLSYTGSTGRCRNEESGVITVKNQAAECGNLPADRSSTDGQLLSALAENYWDIRCINLPTGGDDFDIDWIVVEHHMAEPRERTIAQAYCDDPRVAIRRAIRANDTDAETCVACGEVLHDGDTVYFEPGEEGHIHSHCAGDDPNSFVNEDGKPLTGQDPLPEPFRYMAGSD